VTAVSAVTISIFGSETTQLQQKLSTFLFAARGTLLQDSFFFFSFAQRRVTRVGAGRHATLHKPNCSATCALCFNSKATPSTIALHPQSPCTHVSLCLPPPQALQRPQPQSRVPRPCSPVRSPRRLLQFLHRPWPRPRSTGAGSCVMQPMPASASSSCRSSSGPNPHWQLPRSPRRSHPQNLAGVARNRLPHQAGQLPLQ
jgi:hypothetical protein